MTTLFSRVAGIFAPGYVFASFAGMMVLQSIRIKTMLIETNGAPLKQSAQRRGVIPGS